MRSLLSALYGCAYATHTCSSPDAISPDLPVPGLQSVSPEQSLLDALRTLYLHHVGGVPVLDAPSKNVLSFLTCHAVFHYLASTFREDPGCVVTVLHTMALAVCGSMLSHAVLTFVPYVCMAALCSRNPFEPSASACSTPPCVSRTAPRWRRCFTSSSLSTCQLCPS